MVSAELGTPSAGASFRFENQPDISQNNIRLYGIQAFTADQLSKDDQNRTVVSAAAAKGITVNIVDKENEVVYENIPLTQLVTQNNGGFTTLTKPTIVNLTSCQINLNDTTGLSEGEVVVLNFLFDWA